MHRHKWVVVAQEKLPSAMDRLIAAGATNFKGDLWLHRQDVVVHYRCECGAEKVVRL